MEKVQQRLRGLFPAPAVPFDGDLRIAEAEFAAHLQAMAGVEGVSGVAVNGHAGEIASLNKRERVRVVEIARASLPPAQLVIAGLDAPSGSKGLTEMTAMKEAGADAALVLPPFDTMARRALGNRDDAVIGYFEELGEAGLPLIAFQYPKASGCSYATRTLVEVTALPHVVGVKNAVWDAELYAEQFYAVRGKAAVLAACDAPELLTMMMVGADGLLLGASNVGTDLWARFVLAIAREDFTEAREIFVPRLMPMLDAQFGTTRRRSATFTALTKESLRQLGVFSSAAMRTPEVSPDDEDCAAIATSLQAAGLLPDGEATR